MSREIHFNPMTYEEYKEDKIIHGCNYSICADIAKEKFFNRFKKSYNIKKIDFDSDTLKVFKWDACICMIEEDDGHIVTKYPVEYYKLEKKFKDIYLIDLIQILGKQDSVNISEKENNELHEREYDRVVDIPEKYYNYKVLVVGQCKGIYYIVIEKENN